MCWHCNDWWPLTPLGKAVLGLPRDEPYWLHGLYMEPLHWTCPDAISMKKCNIEPAAEQWLRERTPDYAQIVDDMVPVPKENRPTAWQDLEDICCVELNNTHTLWARGFNADGAINGRLLQDCPEITLWQLSRPVPPGYVASPVKKGRIKLRREARNVEPLNDYPLYYEIE